MPIRNVLVVLALAACAREDRRDVNSGDPGTASGPGLDAGTSDDQDGGQDGGNIALPDLRPAGDASDTRTDTGVGDLSSGSDFSSTSDFSSSADLAHGVDAAIISDGSTPGLISGGPCASGASGATAYRVRWAGSSPGTTAYPVYEVNGLPDKSRDHIGAYTYQIGGTAIWDDPYLGAGGLVLDSSDFVDIELSTTGVTHIYKATLAILGRSFATTSDGSFSWQTAMGIGSTAANAVSNVAPYSWYKADATSEIDAGNAGLLLRIKAGPSSDSLVVNRIELCLVAD